MIEDIKKLLCGVDEDNETIAFVYSLMEEYVKNYCNIDTISIGLKPILCAMTAGYIWQMHNTEKRITRGDTAIEYFSSSEKNSIFNEFQSQLNRFRRVYKNDEKSD